MGSRMNENFKVGDWVGLNSQRGKKNKTCLVEILEVLPRGYHYLILSDSCPQHVGSKAQSILGGSYLVARSASAKEAAKKDYANFRKADDERDS